MRFFILLLLISGCESLIYSDYKIINTKNINNNKTYKVVEGDNLYSISRKLNISIRTLIDINKISSPYKIYPKQLLNLPVSSFHIVEKGETLYSISRMYKTDIFTISRLNNIINVNAIYEGQSLRINKYLVKNNSSNKSSKHKKINKQQRKPLSQTASKKPKISKTKSLNNMIIKSKFIWPVKGKLISKYGKSSEGFFNDGINIDSKLNQNVMASSDGKVIYSGNEIPGYGNLVLIKHSSNWITAYAHLNEVFIEKGAKVKKGEKIGLVGKTGNVSKPQLHFEIRKGKNAVNPLKYLS